jgi:hypothetical protein
VTHFIDGEMEHIDRIPIRNIGGPATLLVFFDECQENIELISRLGPGGGAPKTIYFLKRGTTGATQEFLTHFGLGSRRDLPGIDDLKAAGLLDPLDEASFQLQLESDGEED